MACFHVMFVTPVAGWTDTVVPSFHHSAHCRYWPPSASICVWENMCCSTHTRQLWQQNFSAAGPQVWNASPSHRRRA